MSSIISVGPDDDSVAFSVRQTDLGFELFRISAESATLVGRFQTMNEALSWWTKLERLQMSVGNRSATNSPLTK